jgi:Tol biopolymer transport system component
MRLRIVKPNCFLFFIRAAFSLTILLLCFLILTTSPHQIAAQGELDVLVYSVWNYDQAGERLFKYEPATGETTLLYESNSWLHFALSKHGRIVISTDWRWHNNGEMFSLDTLSNGTTPVNFTSVVGMRGYPLGWSPDGEDLVFASWRIGNDSRHGEDLRLYMWHGETVSDITPNFGNGIVDQYHRLDWSSDGRLLFSVSYSYASSEREELPTRFLWDGTKIIPVDDILWGIPGGPIWSPSDELIFGRTVGRGIEIITWDGVSYWEGIPVTESMFIPVPRMVLYSPIIWTPEGHMVFGAQSAEDTHVQLYLWDGQTVTNISQNPDAHNGSARWSDDGYWAFGTYFSPQHTIFIRNVDNKTVHTLQASSGPAWSLTKELVFCRYDDTAEDGSWGLFMWSAAGVIELARGAEIYAHWQSGQETVCSSG